MMLLEGKTALVFGVANDHSIAWGIAKSLHEHGARLAFSYAGEALERRVRPLANSVGSTFVEPCDVATILPDQALFAAPPASWASSTAWSTPSPTPGGMSSAAPSTRPAAPAFTRPWTSASTR